MSSLAHLRFLPQATVGGDGAWLIDETGRRILDMSAPWLGLYTE